jgi:cytochrome oxidase assembly protein ShyY1
MYVLEAIVARIGEADQSLLFWYLPILFIGLIVLAIGLGLGIWGARRLRKKG